MFKVNFFFFIRNVIECDIGVYYCGVCIFKGNDLDIIYLSFVKLGICMCVWLYSISVFVLMYKSCVFLIVEVIFCRKCVEGLFL